MKKTFAVLYVLLIVLSTLVLADIEQAKGGNFKVKVHIERGWNLLFGVPTIPKYSRPLQEGSTINKEDIIAIYWYHPFEKEYIQIYPGDFQGIPGLADKYAYIMSGASWVYSSRAGDFVYGQIDPVPFEQKKLVAGWNFVGIFKEIKMKKVSQIKGSCEFEKIVLWNDMDQEYIVIDSEERINVEGTHTNFEDIIIADSDSDVGKGLLIKTANECQLGSVTPPPIPD